jgi:hypothetical protein
MEPEGSLPYSQEPLKKYWSREKEEISDSVEFDVQSYLDL